MELERKQYQQLLLSTLDGHVQQQQHNPPPPSTSLQLVQLQQCIKRYNQYRQDAIHARWELLVHRQAAGFIVHNHEYVMKHYPIPAAFVLPEALQRKIKEVKEKESSSWPNEETSTTHGRSNKQIKQNQTASNSSSWSWMVRLFWK
jgi:hypothetical protein